MRERIQTGLLIALMLAVGAMSWQLQLRPPLRVDAAPLAALPTQLGPWIGGDLPLSNWAEGVLNADHHVQRVYLSRDDGDLVWLYVGYYGTARGGRPEHTLEVCYTSAGWRIAEPGAAAREQLDDGRSVSMRVELDGSTRLVQYWYHSVVGERRAGRLALSLDHLKNRLRGERADGALVRISTPIGPGGEERAAERLLDFGRRLAPLLNAHWPEESLPDGDGPTSG